MKHRIHFLFALLLLATGLTSCFEDESTTASRPLAEIYLAEGCVKDAYNLSYNDTLTITPKVSQSATPLALQYAWEVEDKVISTDPTLTYVAKELGSFQCRLIVENADGKTFYPFTINVNTSFEEGLAIVSRNAQGESHLAFMLNDPETGMTGFYDYDCFSAINPAYPFASNVVDMAHSSNQLIIACQGSGVEGDQAAVYYLNDKTFDLENILEADANTAADFKPLSIAIPRASYSGGAYPIICESGKIFDAAGGVGGVVVPASKLHNVYSPCIVNASSRGDASEWSLLFWDKTLNGLALIYKSYGPFYCSHTYHLGPTDPKFSKQNYFAGMDFKAMTRVRQTRQNLAGGREELLVFTTSPETGMTTMVRLAAVFHSVDEDLQYTLQDNGGFFGCGMASLCPLDENTPMIANNTYNTLFYAKGNKIFSVNYRNMFVLNSNSKRYFKEVGPPDAIITDFELSADHTKTYVSFYEPLQGDKNGSVWVINTQTGETLQEFNNVCYQPMRMLYKEK